MTALTRPSLWARVVARVRETSWAVDANDGIIATAGLLQGFAGAGAGDRLLLFAATAATLAGGLSAGGAKWAETAAEREGQLRLAADESAELAADPDAELAELAAYWESRGLTPALAHDVAVQLSERDALGAQLDAEHGLEEIMAPSAPFFAGVETAIAFMIGAAVPLLITYFAPVNIETTAIVVAVVISLVLTSLLAAGVGKLSGVRMLIRSLFVGLGTMGVSYLAGLAFF